jgi:hypothetical protein
VSYSDVWKHGDNSQYNMTIIDRMDTIQEVQAIKLIFLNIILFPTDLAVHGLLLWIHKDVAM